MLSMGLTMFEIIVIALKLKLRKIIPNRFNFSFLVIINLNYSEISAALMYDKIFP